MFLKNIRDVPWGEPGNSTFDTTTSLKISPDCLVGQAKRYLRETLHFTVSVASVGKTKKIDEGCQASFVVLEVCLDPERALTSQSYFYL